MENPTPIEIKIVLAGETSVGKTCFVERVLKGVFTDQSSTLGVLYSTLEGEIDGKKVIYQIWDTAGQENYRNMAPIYFNGSHAVICVFSVTDRESFDLIDDWVESIHQRSNKEIIIFFVGNKIDLEEERKVSEEEGKRKAQQYGAFYHEISAKTGGGFDNFLYNIGKEFLSQKEERERMRNANKSNPPNKDLNDKNDINDGHSCCLLS